jgi:hypothetical protein
LFGLVGSDKVGDISGLFVTGEHGSREGRLARASTLGFEIRRTAFMTAPINTKSLTSRTRWTDGRRALVDIGNANLRAWVRIIRWKRALWSIYLISIHYNQKRIKVNDLSKLGKYCVALPVFHLGVAVTIGSSATVSNAQRERIVVLN